ANMMASARRRKPDAAGPGNGCRHRRPRLQPSGMSGAAVPPTVRMARLADESATVGLARRIGGGARAGDVLAPAGDLGVGKPRFARAFIDAMTGDGEEVPSPTFTLVQTYESPAGTIWHFDLYRLSRPAEAYELGIEDAFAEGITVIEWPERLQGLLPS